MLLWRTQSLFESTKTGLMLKQLAVSQKSGQSGPFPPHSNFIILLARISPHTHTHTKFWLHPCYVCIHLTQLMLCIQICCILLCDLHVVKYCTGFSLSLYKKQNDISEFVAHIHIWVVSGCFHQIDFSQEMAAPKKYDQDLKDIVARDPLHPLFERDKEIIWRFKWVINSQQVHVWL